MSHRNLVALHRYQAERLGPLSALRYKRHGVYHDFSWAEYREQAVAAAAALVEAGVAPGDRVGLVGENRIEWLVADMAILTAGAVNVPPHCPLTAAQVHFQLADAGRACSSFPRRTKPARFATSGASSRPCGKSSPSSALPPGPTS